MSPIHLGDAGRCPEKPALVIADFDNSGSVAGLGGNDPIGNRFAEVRLAFEAVARCCRCGRELGAVTNFDTPTRADVAPTNLKSGMSIIERGFCIPNDGVGSSVLGPSLGAVRRMVDGHPDHDAVLVVLSDFELYDGDVEQVLMELCDFPGLVHVVVLRSAPPTRLVDDPRVKLTHIAHGEPPGAVAKAVFAALTTNRRRKRGVGR
jgi:hypothetical protein